MNSYGLISRLIRYTALIGLLFLIAQSVLAQESILSEFDQTLTEKTVTFEAPNPYTNAPGAVTITVSSAAFHAKRLGSGRKVGWIIVTGEQQGNFQFVPYDSSQPTFTGTFKFKLSGKIPVDRERDGLTLDFIIKTTGSDGSEVVFTQRELATINEYGTDVSFGELKRLEAEARPADKQ